MQTTNERNKEVHRLVKEGMENEGEIKEIIEESHKKCEESISTLKDYIKVLYEKTGLGWTEENDKEIEDIANNIINYSVTRSVKSTTNVILDIVYPVKEE